jgi:hypothetical protein
MEKTLAPGEVRFRVNTRLVGRRITYEIYDRVTGSIPVYRNRLDRQVKQSMTSLEEAEAERDWIEEAYRGHE